MMRFKRGDFVISLIEKGTVREGDVGTIDAVHPDSYTVGFYATEDALLYSGTFFDEELAPYQKEEARPSFIEGDIVELLADYPSLPKGSVGEIVASIGPGIFAMSSGVEGAELPLLVPVKEKDLRRIGHRESDHHH